MDLEQTIVDLRRLKEELFSGRARNFIIGRRRTRLIGRSYRVKEISQWRRGESLRSIDWKLTLATWPRRIYKLERVETKEVPTLLAVDLSPSLLLRFAAEDNKFSLLLRLLATLGFTSIYFGDPVSITSFGSTADFFLPARHGPNRVFTALKMLLENADHYYRTLEQAQPVSGGGLNLNDCLGAILQRMKKQAVIFVISDFMEVLYRQLKLNEEILAALVARHGHNLIFLILEDKYEFSWPKGWGTIMTRDIESGRLFEMKADQAHLVKADFKMRQQQWQKYLSDQGIDSLVISARDYAERLSNFLASRRKSFN